MTFNQITKLIAYGLFFLILGFIGLETLKAGKNAFSALNNATLKQLETIREK